MIDLRNAWLISSIYKPQHSFIYSLRQGTSSFDPIAWPQKYREKVFPLYKWVLFGSMIVPQVLSIADLGKVLFKRLFHYLEFLFANQEIPKDAYYSNPMPAFWKHATEDNKPFERVDEKNTKLLSFPDHPDSTNQKWPTRQKGKTK